MSDSIDQYYGMIERVRRAHHDIIINNNPEEEEKTHDSI